MSFKSIISVFALLVVFAACGNEENYIPKPKAYHRLIFPEKSYENSNLENCPFAFEMPKYASFTKDTLYFNQAASDPCWMDIAFDGMNGKIHLSYKAINEKTTFPKLLEDTYKLTSKHVQKAEFIDDQVFHRGDVHGLLYDVGGDAASAIQFFVTDSTNHFLRGALYFQSRPNYDSIRPVVDFIKVDIEKMLNTFEWK